jgi:hypothetical protein
MVWQMICEFGNEPRANAVYHLRDHKEISRSSDEIKYQVIARILISSDEHFVYVVESRIGMHNGFSGNVLAAERLNVCNILVSVIDQLANAMIVEVLHTPKALVARPTLSFAIVEVLKVAQLTKAKRCKPKKRSDQDSLHTERIPFRAKIHRWESWNL